MAILGIDTAMTTGGVALIEGQRIMAEYILDVRATHSERLMPAIDLVLKDTSLDGEGIQGIAVALGPGSFTGLRIGVATAKALAYTWHKPLIGVSCLEGLAYQVGYSAPWVCALVDARHDEVYGCLYKIEELPEAVMDAKAGPVEEFIKEVLEMVDGRVCFTGDGAVVYKDIIDSLAGDLQVVPPLNSSYLRASSIALLGREYLNRGREDDPLTLAPLYLRLPEAERRLKARG